MPLVRLSLFALLLASPLLRAQPSGPAKIQNQMRAGQLAEAVAEADRLLAARPGDVQLWILKGIALRMQGDTPRALAALRKAVTLQPKFVPALEALAQVEYQSGDPAARKTLERIVALQPRQTTAHAMLAALAFERKDCSAAVAHTAQAPRETSANALARDQYVTCLFRLKEFETAAAFLARQLAAGETSDDLRFNLGLAQFEAKQYSQAVATLTPLARKTVPESAVLGLLSSAYDANNQTPEAIQTLRQAIDIYPRDERHYVDLAALCLERNSLAVGFEVLKIGEKNIPQSAKIQVMTGVLLARAGKLEEAELAFKRAEALDPSTAYGRVGLAAMLLQFNAVEEAISLMRDQVARDPQDPRAATLLAQAILQKGNSAPELREAETLLQRAIQQAPADARAYSLLGKVFSLQERFDQAVPPLENAIRLNPADRTSTYQLMTVYRRLGRTQDAQRLQAKVRELLETERRQESEEGRYRLAIPDAR